MKKILIADDESSIRTILSKLFRDQNYEVALAQNGTEAEEKLIKENIDMAFIDIRMPDYGALEILQNKKFNTDIPVVVMTAQDTMDNAIEATKRGAADYITKPFDLDEILNLVKKNTTVTSNDDASIPSVDYQSTQPGPQLIGRSRPMIDIFKTIGRVANQDVHVLIQGESGTGKEIVAQAIHYRGNRSHQAFVAINCSAIPETLLESELFGAKKGAYTGLNFDKVGYFERAEGGTLFLDEIGDMPLHLQSKLLRVLQEKQITRLGESTSKPIDVRIIAATHQPLKELVDKKLFREDLFFRLNVVPLTIPPLRERKTDIPLLIDFFLKKNAGLFSRPQKKISDAALDFLIDQYYSGNVRELENILKRADLMSSKSLLDLDDFLPLFPKDKNQLQTNVSFEEAVSHHIRNHLTNQDGSLLPVSLFFEKTVIEVALKHTQGNQIEAARLLGINRNTLRRKIKEFEIHL